MFGNTVKISNGKMSLILRPGRESDIPRIAKGVSDLQVMKYLGGIGGVTEKMEKDWFEKISKSDDAITWIIQPSEVDYGIGDTSLHGIRDIHNRCSSGCLIWEKAWWGKGIASLCHIFRCWYAVNYLNRTTIESSVYEPNEASWRALERVGYIRTGSSLANRVIHGERVRTFYYSWPNPKCIDLLFPDGVPQDYLKQIEKAKETLKMGDEIIEYV